MSSATRSKRSSSDPETEPSPKKVRGDEGEPIPVEEAAAAEGMPAVHALHKPSGDKSGLAAQIDLSHSSPTDPNAFNDFLFALLAHKAENNNFHVSREENPHLHVWLGHLKREYKSFISEEVGSSLTDVQVKVLEHLHVPLTSRGDDHWNRFFQLLEAYNVRHGHVLVPRLCEIPGLGDWVTDQRRQFKAWKQGQASQLTKERRDRLEGLGFAWQVRNRPASKNCSTTNSNTETARYVQNRRNRLQPFTIWSSHCFLIFHDSSQVPQHYKENKALGKWVAKQREQHKLLKKGQHSFLTPYRLEKLNSVGFVWSVRASIDGANPDEDDDVPEAAQGVLPAAAAIAAPKEEDAVETKAADVPQDGALKKEEEDVTEI